MTKPTKLHKQIKVLNFINENVAVTFSQIQQFICEMNGKDWNLKINGNRKYRGYWVTSLVMPEFYYWGAPTNRAGILTKWAVKIDGKWQLNNAGRAELLKFKEAGLI